MLSSRSRWLLIGLTLFTGLAIVGVVLTSLRLPAASTGVVASPVSPATMAFATSSSVAPQPAVSDIAATVNGATISRAEWQHVTALDRVMSQLANQPPPDAETTLQRLINERLVLQQATANALSDQVVQQRLDFLKQTWRVDDATLDRTLTLNGLTSTDLFDDVRRLLIVEAGLKQIAATQNPDEWLAAQRAQAQIGLYTDLAVAAQPAQPAAPKPTSPPAPTVVAVSALPTGYNVNQQAIDFALNDLTGKPVKLSDQRGHITVVNFWATWCPPCRSEVPALQAAYQKYQSQNVVLLGVDLKEDAAAIQQFIAPYGVTYPIVRDADGSVAAQYQVAGIPTTLVVDANGVIRARHIGPITEEQLAAYVDPVLKSVAPTLTPVAALSKIAPDFNLPRETGQSVKLSDYRDKSTVVLVFYRGQT